MEVTLADIRKEETLKRNCSKYCVNYVGPDQPALERELMRKEIQRNRKRNERQQETKEAKLARRDSSKIRMQRARDGENTSKWEANLQRNKFRMQQSREKESSIERCTRQHKNKLSMQRHRKQETTAEKQDRQYRDRIQTKSARANESGNKKRMRRQKDKLHKQERRANESPSETKHRNLMNSIRMKKMRAVEKSIGKKVAKKHLNVKGKGSQCINSNEAIYQHFDVTNILVKESGMETMKKIPLPHGRGLILGNVDSPIEYSRSSHVLVLPIPPLDGQFPYSFHYIDPQPTEYAKENNEKIVICGYNKQGEFGISWNIMQQMNFSGDVIRELAYKNTDSNEGMKMNMTINYLTVTDTFGKAMDFFIPIPYTDGMNLRKMDIEDISDIVNGRMIFNTRPAMEKFEIIGKRGHIYACGCVNDARYIVDPDYWKAGFHVFTLPLSRKRLCPKSQIFSSEIHINGYKAISMDEGECSPSTSSIIERDEGRYKKVTHFFECEEDEAPWCWRQFVTLDITFGPLPENYELNGDYEYEANPYQILLDSNDMRFEFTSLTFEERGLRKGDASHCIAYQALVDTESDYHDDDSINANY